MLIELGETMYLQSENFNKKIACLKRIKQILDLNHTIIELKISIKEFNME